MCFYEDRHHEEEPLTKNVFTDEELELFISEHGKKLPVAVTSVVKVDWKLIEDLPPLAYNNLISYSESGNTRLYAIKDLVHTSIVNKGGQDVYSFSDAGHNVATHKAEGNPFTGGCLEINITKTAPPGSDFAKLMKVPDKADDLHRVFMGFVSLRLDHFRDRHTRELTGSVWVPELNLIFSLNPLIENYLTVDYQLGRLREAIFSKRPLGIDDQAPMNAFVNDGCDIEYLFYSCDGESVQAIPVHRVPGIEVGKLILRNSFERVEGYPTVDVHRLDISDLQGDTCEILYDKLALGLDINSVRKWCRDNPLKDRIFIKSSTTETKEELLSKIKELEKELLETKRRLQNATKRVDTLEANRSAYTREANKLMSKGDITSNELKAFCKFITQERSIETIDKEDEEEKRKRELHELNVESKREELKKKKEGDKPEPTLTKVNRFIKQAIEFVNSSKALVITGLSIATGIMGFMKLRSRQTT